MGEHKTAIFSKTIFQILGYGFHIGLEQNFPSRRQSVGDRHDQFRLRHPAFIVPLLKPGVGKLDADPLQGGGQSAEEFFWLHVDVAKEIMEIFKPQAIAGFVGFQHQGLTDFHPQKIPIGVLLGHFEGKATPGTANV